MNSKEAEELLDRLIASNPAAPVPDERAVAAFELLALRGRADRAESEALEARYYVSLFCWAIEIGNLEGLRALASLPSVRRLLDAAEDDRWLEEPLTEEEQDALDDASPGSGVPWDDL